MTQPKQNPAAGNHGENNTHWRDAATSDPSTSPHIGHHRLDPDLAALKVIINSPAGIIHDEAKDVVAMDFERPYSQNIFSTWRTLAIQLTEAGHGTAEVNPSLVYDQLQRDGHTQALAHLHLVVTHVDEPKVARFQVPKVVSSLKYGRFLRAMGSAGYTLQQAALDGSEDKAEQAMHLIPLLVHIADRAGITTGEAA